MKKYTIISFDPGNKGGITVLSPDDEVLVFSMPVIKQITGSGKKKKTKTVYDVKKISEIAKEYSTDDTIFAIEKVSSRPGEGVVSSFNFGMGYGELIGISVSISGELPLLVSPTIWKKYFPELIIDEMEKMKDEQKELRSELKQIEDDKLKKQYKKDIKNIQVKIKKESKTQSRVICQEKYPDIKDEFKKVQDDGKSDSLLIGLYVKDNLEKLLNG